VLLQVDQAASIKTWEAVMFPHEQMVVGVAAGLFLYTLLYWSPGWRHLLAAVVAAGLTDFALISHVHRELDTVGAFTAQPGEILGSTHFRLGVALAFASVSAALRTLRQNNN
jgi:hypothetical protein